MLFLSKSLRFIFICLYQALFYVLDVCIPSKHKTVSFYVTDKTFGDNLFLFYNYLLEKEVTVSLIIQDKALFLKLKQTHPNVFYVKSISGFINYFRSECVTIQNGDAKLFFFPLLLNPKTKFILNLWHGIPLKRLNRQVKHYQQKRSFVQYQKMSALVVSSEFEQLLMSACFYMSLDDIWVTGTPRNDELTSPLTNEFLSNYSYKKVMLYAPTWREYGNITSFFPFEDYNETQLLTFLEQNDLYLFLRGHRLEMNLLKEKYNTLLEKSERIIVADQEKYPNTSDLLKISSVLITDYSSIYLDFLLLNKPIIFIPYDLEEYSNYRGFLFDYHNHTPGKKVFTQKNFLNELQEAVEKPTKNSHLLLQELTVMHKFNDEKAKDRIYQKLSSKLNWQD